MAQRRLSQPEPVEPPLRPRLVDQPSRFVLLEREVELEYKPQMLEALQRKVNPVDEQTCATVPECPRCGRPMSNHDARPVSWLAHCGRLHASPAQYRCSPCKQERRPLLDLLGVEPGRLCGSLARRLGLLAAVAPYQLAARLAQLLLGVTISAMGGWRVAQRLGLGGGRLQ
jgi:ribosomal protein S27AE